MFSWGGLNIFSYTPGSRISLAYLYPLCPPYDIEIFRKRGSEHLGGHTFQVPLPFLLMDVLFFIRDEKILVIPQLTAANGIDFIYGIAVCNFINVWTYIRYGLRTRTKVRFWSTLWTLQCKTFMISKFVCFDQITLTNDSDISFLHTTRICSRGDYLSYRTS